MAQPAQLWGPHPNPTLCPISPLPGAVIQHHQQCHIPQQVLLRARAIESQCYVVAAAQTGKNHEHRTSYGHALVVDPWGAVVAQCHEGTGLCYAEIDLDYLRRIRQEIPVHSHRRPDLYGTVAAMGLAPVP